MLGECEVPRIDGDGGVSMIVVDVAAAGASAMGPTRRATFGGGLKLTRKIKFHFFNQRFAIPIGIANMMQSISITLVEFCVEFPHFVWAMNSVLQPCPRSPLFGFPPSILVVV